MERVLALKRGQNDSHISTSSNLGYETAMDFSNCSSDYYSLSDQTLEANPPICDQSTIEPRIGDPTELCGQIQTMNFSTNHTLTPITQNGVTTSTPLTENSMYMNKSRVSTNTVRRNLAKIGEIPEQDTEPQKCTVEVDDVLVTSTSGTKSTQTAEPNKSPVKENHLTTDASVVPISEKENSAPTQNVNIDRESISKTFRRQSNRIFVADRLRTIRALDPIPETDRAGNRRVTRKSMMPHVSALEAPKLPAPPVTLNEPIKTGRALRMSLAPPKTFNLNGLSQRHALRKTISKPVTPQRRALRSSLTRQSIVINPRTPSGKPLARPKTPLNPKTSRSTLAKPKTPSAAKKAKTPARKSRRQTLAVPKMSPLNQRQASFTCTVCAKTFVQKSTLTAHQRIHDKQSTAPPAPTQPKPTFNCTICSKSFLQQSTLNSHQRTHGLGPKLAIPSHINTCRFCDKLFAITQALTTHLQLHCTKIPSGERRKLMLAPAPPAVRVAKSIKRPAVLDPASAHSGVYRTPSRTLKCKACAMSFMDRNEFVEHMETH